MIRLRKLLESRGAVAAATALGVAAVLIGLEALGAFQAAELGLYDRYLRRIEPRPDAGSRVVVVTYTEADIQDPAIGFPLADDRLGAVLETVLRGGPRGVGVDFYRDILIPPGSERLEAVLKRDPRVVMIYRFGDGDVVPIPPPKVLEGTDQIGLADLVLDPDKVARRAVLYQDDEELGTGLSLALRVALLYLAADKVSLGVDPDDETLLRLGPTTIPRLRGSDGGYAGVPDGGYQTFIRWESGEPLRSISMHEVLAGDFDPDLFRDKMVFVGVSAETHSDLIDVPFGHWPGVFVHGHIASELVHFGLGESRPLRVWSDWGERGWVLLWAALGATWGLSRRSVWTFGAVLLAGTVGQVGVGYLGLREGWWIPAVAPALAWGGSASAVTAYLSRRERAERSALMLLFSRHVSHRVADQLWERREEFLDGGRPRPQRLTATVMFVDIRGFTSTAEKLDPERLMEWLNAFMGAMADEAERHGGFVDDYFGDGLKVNFGVPVPRRSEEEICADCEAAVRCALSMGRRLARVNASWREQGLPTGAMRVGIATGTAVAGSLGSADRLKYTVVGDTVNTAARLESFDDSKHDYSQRLCRILVAEETRILVEDRFSIRDFGRVSLKGKAEPVQVFEVLGEPGEAREEVRT